MAEQLNERGRNEILVQQIPHYVNAGWVLQSQAPTTASFMKKKKFSFWWAFVWFVLGIIPLFFYIIYYMSKSDRSLVLTVDEFGTIATAES